MNILFIAPVPPPLTGHSLASEVLLKKLEEGERVELVNLSKNSLQNGISSIGRVGEIGRILSRVLRGMKLQPDLIYFTISESVLGNIKDILIYLACYRKLPRMLIHLHGGSLRRLLFNRHRFLFAVNRFFLRRVGGIVVLSPSHVSIFSDFVNAKKIYVVPNFAAEDLFLDDDVMQRKFSSPGVLRFLFLSNLIEGKGHGELLDAYLALDTAEQAQIRLDFAGAFETGNAQADFIAKIQNLANVEYHGIATGQKKKELLENAHIFCLPSRLLEGQPISILEAYAAGCVVVASNPPGIADILKEGENGYLVDPYKPATITAVLRKILAHNLNLYRMAVTNAAYARSNFRMATYLKRMTKIINTTSK